MAGKKAAKTEITAKQQWDRLIMASLDFANDIRLAMDQPKLDALPDTSQRRTCALSVAIGSGCQVHRTYLEIPIEKLSIDKLPANLKQRAFKNDKEEPTAVHIWLPLLVEKFIEVLDSFLIPGSAAPISLKAIGAQVDREFVGLRPS